MKIFYSLPASGNDFRFYSHLWVICKKAAHIFLIVSSLLIGLAIFLAAYEMIKNLSAFWQIIIFAAIWFLFGYLPDMINLRMASFFTRYFFLVAKDRKRWLNIADIILVVLSLAGCAALTLYAFNTAKTSADYVINFDNSDNDKHISEIQTNDDSLQIAKNEINSKYDSLAISRKGTKEDQIKAIEAYLLTIPYTKSGMKIRRTKQDEIVKIQSEKAEIDKDIDIERKSEIEKMEIRYSETRSARMKSGKDFSAWRKKIMSDLTKRISAFLGWDIIMCVIFGCMKEIMQSKSQIQPKCEVEQHDFQHGTVLEVLTSLPSNLWWRMVNMFRSIPTPNIKPPNPSGANYDYSNLSQKKVFP